MMLADYIYLLELFIMNKSADNLQPQHNRKFRLPQIMNNEINKQTR